MSRHYPVILSGGSGTRLWPLSRSHFPKQFVEGLSGQTSLFNQAVKRLANSAFAPPTIVCNTDHQFLVRDGLDDVGIKPRKIVLEPAARNTAPAIAATALDILQDDPEAVLVVVPSDHVIADVEAFRRDVQSACKLAQSGRAVLFGIRPTRPHTGYGYIQLGEALDQQSQSVYHIAAFHEKPNEKTAKEYYASGQFLWNAGIFVLRAQNYISALKQHAPDVLHAARLAVEGAMDAAPYCRLDADAFAQSPSISIDYAVMEKITDAAVMPASFDWSDVGNWQALWEHEPRDDQGNLVSGDVITSGTKNALLRSERGLLATVGLENVVVINTPDAVLVADMEQAEKVGQLAKDLGLANRTETQAHIRNRRPWGYFESLIIANRFQVKKLHVKPGGQLSLQMHHHRSEHWVVVRGIATVTIGEQVLTLSENQSAYITAEQWHRLENFCDIPLEIIEVQIGDYLGEDDIIRSADVYDRG